MTEIPKVLKTEEPVETAEEIEAEINLDTPETKESDPDTEKLVADLKKMIQEVENSSTEEKNPEEAFIDNGKDRDKTVEKPKKKDKKAKKDSWDDIEFL